MYNSPVPVPSVRVHIDRAPAGPQMAVTLAVWFVVVQRFGALVRMACWPTVWSALRAASPTVRPCAGASLSCGVPVVVAHDDTRACPTCVCGCVAAQRCHPRSWRRA